MFTFNIFNIPVRIEPMFLLTMGLLGFLVSQRLASNQTILLICIALFILLAFVSVLLHELGHALTGQRFTNSPVEIVLESFGGHARFLAPSFSKWQYITMVAAGPAMNFLLAGIFALTSFFIIPNLNIDQNNLLVIFITYGIYINIFWGLFNLVPVFPLDGGHIMHSFIKNPRKAHKISLVLAIIMMGIGLSLGAIIAVMFFGFMAYQNYQIMTMIRGR